MVYSTLKQSLTFHASPEAFISDRLENLANSNSTALPSPPTNRGIVHASILNRNVEIVSSYRLCRDILEYSNHVSDSDFISIRSTAASHPQNSNANNVFATAPAYRELMAAFFPPPNILLEDPPLHQPHKAEWSSQLSNLPIDSDTIIRSIVKRFIQSSMQPGARLDLYDALKTLAWEVLLTVFLGLDLDTLADGSLFTRVQKSQEALLQGQFSLFPLSVRIPMLWQSARSKGLSARKELQTLLRQHIEEQQQSGMESPCPLLRRKDVTETEDIASHCLLFTSSIANKALASLLTATVMNVFLMPMDNNGCKLVDLVRSHPREECRKLLRSVLLETERLSPPVVGVMRRVQQDLVLSEPSSVDGCTSNDHHVAKGHDVWMYFVGAGRDSEEFEDADSFHFDRFMHAEEDEKLPGFAFGAGLKTCLGRDLVRTVVMAVIEEMLDANIELTGEISSPGVRSWLGWEKSQDPHVFARGLKQLPCQRPRDPVLVSVQRKS